VGPPRKQPCGIYDEQSEDSTGKINFARKPKFTSAGFTFLLVFSTLPKKLRKYDLNE
jgi:hypothetical protein